MSLSMRATTSNDFLHGTLDALILKTLTSGPRHGYAIARWLEDTTGEALQIEEGSLYPALYRMERRGWIDAEWGVSELRRRAKVYRLTARGRRQLDAQTAQWAAFAAAVSKVLLPA
jgi:transcriptional regulator